jgi:hypothetical protein
MRRHYNAGIDFRFMEEKGQFVGPPSFEPMPAPSRVHALDSTPQFCKGDHADKDAILIRFCQPRYDARIRILKEIFNHALGQVAAVQTYHPQCF